MTATSCIEAKRARARVRARKWVTENRERRREYQRQWYIKNRVNHQIAHRAYITKPSKRMRQLVKLAFWRAKRRGMAYDNELLTALESAPPTACACCGKVLDYSVGRGANKCGDSPSLDRFDNAAGYTITNVRVICFRCNRIKSDATVMELESVLDYMRRN